MTGTQRDPGITKQRATTRKKKAAENAAGLSVAEKLTRASKEETTNVSIAYSEGDFDIEVRLAMVSEQDRIKQMLKGVTPDKDGQIDQGMAEMLASHSVDESLDAGFWAQSDFSPTIFLRVFYAILGLSEEKVKSAQEIIEAQSFRSD